MHVNCAKECGLSAVQVTVSSHHTQNVCTLPGVDKKEEFQAAVCKKEPGCECTGF